MAEQYRFFGSAVGDTREYSQTEFAEVLGTIIGNGYLGQVDNELIVTQNTPAGMSVLVETGQGWINGYWYANGTTKEITIATSDQSNPRIDLVVLRLDILNARSIVATVKTGTPASVPVAPSLTQTEQLWEIPLAEVYVGTAVLSITDANITDKRYQALLQDTDEILDYVDGQVSTLNNSISLKAPINSPTFTGTVSGITKSMVSLGNVDNTSDANKPISSATQTALNDKLSLGGGTLSGALNGTTATFSGLITANGGQIKFPATQNASADANTLDDYEEGTFTPAIVGMTTAGTGTYNTRYGVYTKIGSFVNVYGWANWSSHTGTGSMTIQGFPFATKTISTYTPITLSCSDITLPSNTVIQGWIGNNDSVVQLYGSPVGGGSVTVVNVDTNGGWIMFNFSYQTN